MKSGYEFLRLKVAETATEGSSSARFGTDFWHNFWKSKSLPQRKEVALRACNGALPVQASLRTRSTVWR